MLNCRQHQFEYTVCDVYVRVFISNLHMLKDGLQGAVQLIRILHLFSTAEETQTSSPY